MAATVTANQLEQAVTGDQQQQGQKPPPPPGAGGGGSGSVPQDVLLRYMLGEATQDDLMALVQAGIITINEASTYYGKTQTQDNSTASDPYANLYPYDPQTGYVSRYPGNSPVGDSHFANGVTMYVDQNGILYDASGKPLPEYQQKAFGGGVGGGGAGNQAQIGYDYAALAQQKALQEQQLAQQAQEFNQNLQQQQVTGKANAGLSLGNLGMNLAQQQYDLAADPGNFPGYLAAQAGLQQPNGSPVNALLGQGVQIQPPAGSNPLADSRYQNLISQLYQYANPAALETVQNIAAQNGGKLPQAFYDYTHTQNPNGPVQQYAKGGTQTLHEPVLGMGLKSMKPRFLAGEAGPEKVKFTPVKAGKQKMPKMGLSKGLGAPKKGTPGTPKTSLSPAPRMQNALKDSLAIGNVGLGGQVPPIQSVGQGPFMSFGRGGGIMAGLPIDQFPAYGNGGQVTAGRMNPAWYPQYPQAPILSFADGGDLTAGDATGGSDTLTPAQATYESAGKGLQALGYAPQNLLSTLLQGKSPTAGMFNEQFLNYLPPSYLQLIQSGIRAQLGRTGLADFNYSLNQNQMPNVNSGYTNASYR